MLDDKFDVQSVGFTLQDIEPVIGCLKLSFVNSTWCLRQVEYTASAVMETILLVMEIVSFL